MPAQKSRDHSTLGHCMTALGQKRTFTVLTELGCDNFQGFLFAKPMPPDTMLRWVLGQNLSRSSSPSLNTSIINV